jgi:hypothetical protein
MPQGPSRRSWAVGAVAEQRILGPASPKRNGAYVAEMSCSITVVIVYGYDRIRMTVIVPAGGHSLFSSDLSDAVLAYKLKRWSSSNQQTSPSIREAT